MAASEFRSSQIPPIPLTVHIYLPRISHLCGGRRHDKTKVSSPPASILLRHKCIIHLQDTKPQMQMVPQFFLFPKEELAPLESSLLVKDVVRIENKHTRCVSFERRKVVIGSDCAESTNLNWLPVQFGSLSLFFLLIIIRKQCMPCLLGPTRRPQLDRSCCAVSRTSSVLSDYRRRLCCVGACVVSDVGRLH